SSAVKRILSEARELQSDPSQEYIARPLETDIFEWHFTLRGPSGTEFARGLYHGRILLPVEYPFRPPNIMLLTPNGRWECNKKICLTFTGFHEEMWQPAWGIRTALLGVQAFMAARAEAAQGVGSLDFPKEERESLAEQSRRWICAVC
ncbi:UBC-like protein, partial [Jaminaea rosea]